MSQPPGPPGVDVLLVPPSDQPGKFRAEGGRLALGAGGGVGGAWAQGEVRLCRTSTQRRPVQSEGTGHQLCRRGCRRALSWSHRLFTAFNGLPPPLLGRRLSRFQGHTRYTAGWWHLPCYLHTRLHRLRVVLSCRTGALPAHGGSLPGLPGPGLGKAPGWEPRVHPCFPRRQASPPPLLSSGR